MGIMYHADGDTQIKLITKLNEDTFISMIGWLFGKEACMMFDVCTLFKGSIETKVFGV